MISLAIWHHGLRIGTLSHDTGTGLFDFTYASDWKERRRNSFPLSLHMALPGLERPGFTPFADLDPPVRSTIVRHFFQNLLPEGQALEVAASANKVSKANLPGLLIALGRETAGALSVTASDDDQAHHMEPGAESRLLREVSLQEISERIRARTEIPFSLWDGAVRLSIAGLQDKIAVYEEQGKYFLVDGPMLASTAILKPSPTDPRFADLPLIEFSCMRLAAALGINTAATELLHVPEPVLKVERFDRSRLDVHVREFAGVVVGQVPAAVHRLHVIDGCQALGLGPDAKYERLYGEGKDVQNIREGASLSGIFSLTEAMVQPLRMRNEMVDRVVFNLLIGNADAHGKNWSFFVRSADGLLELTPAYDLVDVEAFPHMNTSFAMGIGDAFAMEDLSAYQLALMAKACGVDRRYLRMRIKHFLQATLKVFSSIRPALLAAGVRDDVLDGLVTRIGARCGLLAEKSRHLMDVDPSML